MNLSKKKELAAKTLKVGKGRIIFNSENLAEIKEAITRQDIKGLKDEGIISIRPVKGRTKNVKRKHRRGPGRIKKKVSHRKQEYVKITRKLRFYLKNLRERGIVDRDLNKKIRNKIRMRELKSKAGMKDYLKSIDIDFEKVSDVKMPETKKIKKKIEKKVKKLESKNKVGKIDTKTKVKKESKK